MKRILEKNQRRDQRKARVRGKISGTALRPRASVFKSSKHLSIQIIDDTKGITLAAVSTLEKALNLKKNVDDSKKLGLALGERLKKAKIETIVFDRNGYRYHGVIKSVADGMREAGIQF